MAINVEAFYDMINGIARQQVQATPMDLTIDATISKLYNVDIGEYKVEYQGNIFSAFVPNPEVTYNVGERVYVLVPQGDFSTKKVILGYSKYDSNLSDADRTDLANQYIIQGPNWYEVDGQNYLPDHHPLQICAVPTSYRKNLTEGAFWEDVGYQRENLNLQTISVMDRAAKDWATYTDEKKQTVAEDLAANTYEEPTYFLDNLNWQLYDTDADYRQSVITHLNQTAEEQAVKQAAVPADVDKTDGVDQRFQKYAQAYDYLMISAKFRTEFAMPHYAGKYWLSVWFWCTNPKYRDIEDPDADLNRGQQNLILKELKLGFDQFNGSPYTFVVDTPQRAFYQVTPGEFRGLYRVALMQDGALVADITPSYDPETGALRYDETKDVNFSKNNIFCDDIDIRFAKKIDMLENPYYCFIETPQGDSFYKQDETHPNACTLVNLIPHFIHQGQEITQDCQIQWYREDLSVMPSTPDEKDDFGKIWTDYTGPGWRPVMDLADETMGYWRVQEDGKLTVYDVDGSVPWKWRFKCVCIYTPSEGEKMVFGTAVQEVINRNSKYDLYLEEMIDKTNNQTKLRINENAPRRVGMDKIPGTEIPFQEWFGSWYVELADGSYIEVDETSLFRKGPLIINSWLTYSMVTFKVACYDPMMVMPPDGQGELLDAKGHQTQVVGYLEKTFLNNVEGNMMIDWIGRKSFNYNALGSAYPDISVNEYTLQPKLKWHLDPMNYHMIIKAPDGATLGSRNFYNQYLGNGQTFANQSGKGYDVNGKSMMYDMYIDNENVVHFKVQSEIEPTRVLNTLTACVLTIADGTWYECPCEVLFTKDGQSGTQGSGWTAPIKQVDTAEGAGRVVYDPVTERNLVLAAPPFTTPIGFATSPLCIKKGTVDGELQYVQDERARRVVIRPFVTKEGRNLMEDLGDGSKYKVVVNWDVRYAQNATLAQARNSSFLRLCHPISHNVLTLDKTPEDPRDSAFANGSGKGKMNPEGEPGLIAQTVWDGSKTTDERPDNKTYCAVEIRFKDNDFLYKNNMLSPKIDEATQQNEMDIMSCMGYCFVVKATINIYSNDPGDWPKTSTEGKYTDEMLAKYKNVVRVQDGKMYRADGSEVEDVSAGTAYSPKMEKVKTIVSYYPVDIFIEDDDTQPFDPLQVQSMNWPREIQYDPQGGNPQVGADYLVFTYGANDKEHLVEPVSLVQRMATVVKAEDYSQTMTKGTEYGTGDEVDIAGEAAFEEYQRTLEQESISPYKYRPRPDLGWDSGIVGTLEGRINHGLVSGQFIRNQVFMMNMFGNLAVNNWDGHSITLDDENGTILAPTFAAGFKGDFSNLFYGVVMGKNTSFPRVQLNADGTIRNAGGINQLAAVGGPLDEQLQENYMTGIFGYQQGKPSFGLLENGTAFFGRLDRGGGIIIDGYNAIIYGGANGVVTSPKIGDNMWNSMRLTLVDLSHATNGNTDQVYDKDGNAYGVRDDINTYEEYYGVDEDGKPTWIGKDGKPSEYPTYDAILDDSLKEGKGVGTTGENQPVSTGVAGIVSDFGSQFYAGNVTEDDPYGTKRQLPGWYRMVWIGSYLKPKGRAPYWYDDGTDKATSIVREVWGIQDKKTGQFFYGPEGSSPEEAVKWIKQKYQISGSYDLIFVPNPRIVPSLESLSEKIGTDSFQNLYVNASDEKIADLSHQMSNKSGANDLDYSLGNGNVSVNYWNPSIRQIRAYMNADNIKGMEKLVGGPISGFGPSRASTTPAIEIGQHPPGLMPGLIPLDYDLQEIFKEIYIPGDRNFMVTYDGTMWAMNGVFLGNVLGSNIIGGRINGSQIGIGRTLDDSDWLNAFWLSNYGNWADLTGPAVKRGGDGALESQLNEVRTQFQKITQINPNGDALFKKAFLLGGEIHIGTFHILGEYPWYEKSEDKKNGDITSGPLNHGADHIGHLIQFGVSDFLGPTHFYGSLGIGPNLSKESTQQKLPWNDGAGYLLQTGGLAALGIILPRDEDGNLHLAFHAKMAEVESLAQKDSEVWFMNKDVTKNATSSVNKNDNHLYYTAYSYDYGVPNIQSEAAGFSVEQMSMFGIFTKDAPYIADAKLTVQPKPVGVDKNKIGELLSEIQKKNGDYATGGLPIESAGGDKISEDIVRYMADTLRSLQTEAKITLRITYNGITYSRINYSATDKYNLAVGCCHYTGVVNQVQKQVYAHIANYRDTNIAYKDKIETTPAGSGYIGHFWPMSFRYLPVPEQGQGKDDEDIVNPFKSSVHAFMTTMNIFAAMNTTIGGGGTGSEAGGANYFRVGPWGQEGFRYYFTSGWQSEDVSEQPLPNRLNWKLEGGSFKQYTEAELGNKKESFNSPRGFIGVGKGGGGGKDGPPIILRTWGMSKLFLQSDNEISLQAMRGISGWFRDMSLDKMEKQDGYTATDVGAHRVQFNATQWGTGFSMMSNDNEHCTTKDGGWVIDANPDITKYEHKKSVMQFATGIGDGFDNANVSLQLSLKYQSHFYMQNKTVSALTLDPQDYFEFSLPQAYNGGNGGAYLFGKKDSGVHIMQWDGFGNPPQDGTMAEVFLFHEQASLIAPKLVLIGNFPKNYKNVTEQNNGIAAVKIKNSFGGGGDGLSHAPDTTQGAGLAFVGPMMRGVFADGFTLVGGGGNLDLITSQNNGWMQGATMGIGGSGKDHMEIFHKNCVAIHKGSTGNGTSATAANAPKIYVGADESMKPGDAIFLWDNHGGMEGKNGRIRMVKSWAVPDNQFCIYARFG